MIRPLIFREKDFNWIKVKYPDFFELLKKKAIYRNDEIYINLEDQSEYDIIFDAVGDVLMCEVSQKGELTKDGFCFEEAWDYADAVPNKEISNE